MKLRVRNKVNSILEEIKESYLSEKGYSLEQWESIVKSEIFFDIEYDSFSYGEVISYYVKKIKKNKNLISLSKFKELNKKNFSRPKLSFSDYNYFFTIYAKFLYFDNENREKIDFEYAKAELYSEFLCEELFFLYPDNKKLFEFMISKVDNQGKEAILNKCEHVNLFSNKHLFYGFEETCEKCGLVNYEEKDLRMKMYDDDFILKKIKEYEIYCNKTNFLKEAKKQ